MAHTDNNNSVDVVGQRFEKLYPGYDYYMQSSSHEKDTRKRMKAMY